MLSFSLNTALLAFTSQSIVNPQPIYAHDLIIRSNVWSQTTPAHERAAVVVQCPGMTF